jgi:ankyrin repeat protein
MAPLLHGAQLPVAQPQTTSSIIQQITRTPRVFAHWVATATGKIMRSSLMPSRLVKAGLCTALALGSIYAIARIVKKIRRSVTEGLTAANYHRAVETRDVGFILRFHAENMFWPCLGSGGLQLVADYWDAIQILQEAEAEFASAIREGNLQTIQALIRAGIDPNEDILYGAEKRKPLGLAIEFNQKDVLRIFIKAGIDVNYLGGDRRTPLFWAIARGGCVEIIRQLIAAGADVNHADGYGDTPLHEAAAMHGEVAVINALLEAHARINELNRYGDRALHCAARTGHTQAVRLLVNRGAHANVFNNAGETPLHNARRNHREETIRTLIELGAREYTIDLALKFV